MFFKAKKWLWTKFTDLRGADRAYEKYLAHFEQQQANVDSTLQQALQVKPMTKEAFLKVWKPSKQCKPGCCS